MRGTSIGKGRWFLASALFVWNLPPITMPPITMILWYDMVWSHPTRCFTFARDRPISVSCFNGEGADMSELMFLLFLLAFMGLDIISTLFGFRLLGQVARGIVPGEKTCGNKSRATLSLGLILMFAFSMMFPPALAGITFAAILSFALFWSATDERKFAPFVVSLSAAFWMFSLVRFGCAHHFFVLNVFDNTVSIILGIALYSFVTYGQNGVARVKEANAGRVSAYDILASFAVAPLLAYSDIKEALKTFSVDDFLFKNDKSAFAASSNDEGEDAEQKHEANKD